MSSQRNFLSGPNPSIRTGLFVPVSTTQSLFTTVYENLRDHFQQGDAVNVELFNNGVMVRSFPYFIGPNFNRTFITEKKFTWLKRTDGTEEYEGDAMQFTRLPTAIGVPGLITDNISRNCLFECVLERSLISKRGSVKKITAEMNKYPDGINESEIHGSMTRANVIVELYLPWDKKKPIKTYGACTNMKKKNLVKLLLVTGATDSHVIVMTKEKRETIDSEYLPSYIVEKLDCYIQQDKKGIKSGISGNVKYTCVGAFDRQEKFVKWVKDYPLDWISSKRELEYQFIESARSQGGCFDFNPEVVEEWRKDPDGFDWFKYTDVDMKNGYYNCFKAEFYKGHPVCWGSLIECNEIIGEGLYGIKNFTSPKKINTLAQKRLTGGIITSVEIRAYRHLGYEIEIFCGMFGASTVNLQLPAPDQETDGKKDYCTFVGKMMKIHMETHWRINGSDMYLEQIKNLLDIDEQQNEIYHNGKGGELIFTDTSFRTRAHHATMITGNVFSEMALQNDRLDEAKKIRDHLDGSITSEIVTDDMLRPLFRIKPIKNGQFKFHANGWHTTVPWKKSVETPLGGTFCKYSGEYRTDLISTNSGYAGANKSGSSVENQKYGKACIFTTSTALATNQHKKHPHALCLPYQHMFEDKEGKKSKYTKWFMYIFHNCSLIVIDEIGGIEDYNVKEIIDHFPNHKIIMTFGEHQTIIWKGTMFDYKQYPVYQYNTHYRLGSTEKERELNPLTPIVQQLLKNVENCKMGGCRNCGIIPDVFNEGISDKGCFIFRANRLNENHKYIKELYDIVKDRVVTVESLQGDDGNYEQYNVMLTGMSCRHLYTIFTRSGNINDYSIFDKSELNDMLTDLKK